MNLKLNKTFKQQRLTIHLTRKRHRLKLKEIDKG